MNKKDFVRRGSEILAAFVIAGSIIVYTSDVIKNDASYQVALSGLDQPNSNEDDFLSEMDAGQEEQPVDTYKHQIGSPEAVQAMATASKEMNDSTEATSAGMESTHAPLQPDGPPDVFTAQASDTNTNSSEELLTTTAKTNNLSDLELEEPIYKYINANELNVRSGPGTDNEKLATLTRGSKVHALQQHGEWLEIITEDNVKGFIVADYASETPPPVYKYVTANSLNVRSGTSAETEKLSTLTKGSRVQVLGQQDDWMNVITTDSVKGYVLAEYISETAPKVYNYINANQLNVRKGPSTGTSKLATLKSGDQVQFLGNNGEWSKVVTKDDVEGYVLSKYVVANPKQVSRSASSQSHNASLATKILDYAQEFLGVKYVYGGSTPKGFDCSGFTQYVFKKFKISLPRSSEDYASIGSKVSRNDLKPGDLLLFDRYDNWQLGHVGIYIGGDKFIHASTSKGKVVIGTLSKYGGNLLGIRRVIK